jgi:hypothetical protein
MCVRNDVWCGGQIKAGQQHARALEGSKHQQGFTPLKKRMEDCLQQLQKMKSCAT